MEEKITKIQIENKTSDSGSGALQSNVDAGESTSAGGISAETKTKEVSFFASQAEKLLSEAINDSTAIVMYEINKNLNLNDDYIAQRNLAVAQTMISKTNSILSSTLSGAIAGASVGGPLAPVAAAIGATISLATSVASSAIESYKAMDQQDIMLRQMDAQLDYTRQRAGWSSQAASIGEDL